MPGPSSLLSTAGFRLATRFRLGWLPSFRLLPVRLAGQARLLSGYSGLLASGSWTSSGSGASGLDWLPDSSFWAGAAGSGQAGYLDFQAPLLGFASGPSIVNWAVVRSGLGFADSGLPYFPFPLGLLLLLLHLELSSGLTGPFHFRASGRGWLGWTRLQTFQWTGLPGLNFWYDWLSNRPLTTLRSGLAGAGQGCQAATSCPGQPS